MESTIQKNDMLSLMSSSIWHNHLWAFHIWACSMLLWSSGLHNMFWILCCSELCICVHSVCSINTKLNFKFFFFIWGRNWKHHKCVFLKILFIMRISLRCKESKFTSHIILVNIALKMQESSSYSVTLIRFFKCMYFIFYMIRNFCYNSAAWWWCAELKNS